MIMLDIVFSRVSGILLDINFKYYACNEGTLSFFTLQELSPLIKLRTVSPLRIIWVSERKALLERQNLPHKIQRENRPHSLIGKLIIATSRKYRSLN